VIEGLRARFLPRLLETARERIAAATAQLASDNTVALILEMHALAGEAGTVGVPELGQVAREIEETARTWRGGEATARARCELGLSRLRDSVVRLEAEGAQKQPLPSGEE
jgi:HPt (histidine-containing phosphotransfer) domain-containing protein